MAMYCGAPYETIWQSLTRRERWVMSYGQGVFFRPMARVVHELTGHRLLWSAGAFAAPDFPAFVIVRSNTMEGVEHCVYWSGERLLDPQPRSRMSEDWPDGGRMIGLHAAEQFYDDLGAGFDWHEWMEGAGPMTLDGALGRQYAQGLPPWQ